MTVTTYVGDKVVELARLGGDTYPIIAMALGTRRWSKRQWSLSRLEELHDQLLDSLLAGANGHPPAIDEWLRGAGDTSVSLADHQAVWVNPATGASVHTSLLHVVRYVFYIDGGHPIPASLRRSIGSSFCEEPIILPQHEASQATDDDSFFDPLVEDEIELHRSPTARSPLRERAGSPQPDRGRDVTRVRNEPNAPGSRLSETVATGRRVPTHHSGHRGPVSGGAVGDLSLSAQVGKDEMDIEVIKLIRRYKPHLLPIYLGAPARTTDGERRKRNTSPPRDDDPPASKRVRHGFSPTAEQRRAHTVLTAEEHQGKSGDAFVEYVVSSPTIQFVLHPGVLARIYDLQFGSRGLSLMHFRRVGFIDKLRMQAQASFNPSDYTLLPPRPTPAASWSDLGSAARSFLDYCRSVCDPDTVSVAEALERFVSALEGWKQFGDADIPLLVLWIDATLEKYRNASVYDSFNDSTTRKAAADWFSTTNPELHSLLLTSIREQLSVGQLSIANAGHAGHGRPAPRLGVERKIPVDVISSIPTKDGKEVCLQFLSVRGCNPENPDECKYKNRVHFRPATLPPKLLQYIKNKLGGVAKIYSQA